MHPEDPRPLGPHASVLTRRRLLGGLAGTGAVVLVPWPAEAANVVKGRIRETYLAAGGQAVLGRAQANESRQRVNGHNTYGQRFELGRVWWAAGVGKVDLPAKTRVRLDGAHNFRPVLGVRDVWRSNDLDAATALDERIVRDLGVRTMIAFNGGSDPVIRSVKDYAFDISNSGTHLDFYRGYVSRAASRESIGRTLSVIAATTHAVVIHCQAGKDRTGWVSEVLQRLGGVAQSVRDADYLATHTYVCGGVPLAWLQAARDQLAASYDDLDGYLTTGCGLPPATVTALRRRLAPA